MTTISLAELRSLAPTGSHLAWPAHRRANAGDIIPNPKGMFNENLTFTEIIYIIISSCICGGYGRRGGRKESEAGKNKPAGDKYPLKINQPPDFFLENSHNNE
jgi:hypothetical protein